MSTSRPKTVNQIKALLFDELEKARDDSNIHGKTIGPSDYVSEREKILTELIYKICYDSLDGHQRNEAVFLDEISASSIGVEINSCDYNIMDKLAKLREIYIGKGRYVIEDARIQENIATNYIDYRNPYKEVPYIRQLNIRMRLRRY